MWKKLVHRHNLGKQGWAKSITSQLHWIFKVSEMYGFLVGSHYRIQFVSSRNFVLSKSCLYKINPHLKDTFVPSSKPVQNFLTFASLQLRVFLQRSYLPALKHCSHTPPDAKRRPIPIYYHSVFICSTDTLRSTHWTHQVASERCSTVNRLENQRQYSHKLYYTFTPHHNSNYRLNTCHLTA